MGTVYHITSPHQTVGVTRADSNSLRPNIIRKGLLFWKHRRRDRPVMMGAWGLPWQPDVMSGLFE